MSLGYIYHLIEAGTGKVLDETSLDDKDIDHATYLFCEEFGYNDRFDAGDVDVVFVRTEEEDD